MSVATSEQQPQGNVVEPTRAVGKEDRRHSETPEKKKVRRPRIPRVGETLTQSGTPSASGWASCIPLGALESVLREAVVETTTLRKPAE